MSRYHWLAAFFGWLILGGCSSSSDEDVPKTVQTTTDLGSSVSLSACQDTAAHETVYQAQIGTPVVVTVSRATVTRSCHCEYTDYGSGWGCSSAKQCVDEYDLGGQNPQVCDIVDSVPAPLDDVTVTTGNAECRTSVDAIDTSTKSVSVTCTERGQVDIQILAAGAASQTAVQVFFSDDGALCPATLYPTYDAGAADTGTEADSDAADSGGD